MQSIGIEDAMSRERQPSRSSCGLFLRRDVSPTGLP